MELSAATLGTLLENQKRLEHCRQEAASKLESIDVISEPISYETFYAKYLVRNIPCVIDSWVTANWQSVQTWNNDGQINWHLLDSLFGDATVPVADCTEQQEYSQSKQNVKFSEFTDYMTSVDRSDKHILYLKDWHFQRDFPSYSAYTVPVYFHSDWLNEFWDSQPDLHDDYRFVYIGPKGSWTAFHSDVMRSFSWSANICGTKYWILVPSGCEELLKDSAGNIPFDINPSILESANVKYFELTQNTGQVLFVPSGWYHQVVNMEDTISINHNWFNASNVDIVWKFVYNSLLSVEQEIIEHKSTMDNWTEHCQLFLKANIGFNLTDLYNLLLTAGTHRLMSVPAALTSDHMSAAGGQVPAHSRSRILTANGDEPADSMVPTASAGSQVPSDCYSLSAVNATFYDLFCVNAVINEMASKQQVCDTLCVNAESLLCSCKEFNSQLQTTLQQLANHFAVVS